ncbi:MAG: glycoside hydrolase family 43 protein [Flavobacteriaceae bacterium]|nr:glycoside hydrolase family 43 protein [Flavobacteriaceae bacterium]
MNAQTFKNPILAGGYPDPSICRVGNEFIMVNSSFEYFPALPIHKSKDLVNWELAGHGLNRLEQVSGQINLIDVQSNGGIHAPTIRFHNGKYHIITTNVYYDEIKQRATATNFIITSSKPEGPWSNPIIIKGAPGIDPDIFFDDDGRVWYTGNHQPLDPTFNGETEIWMQELDPNSFQLIGQRFFVWRGACGGVWAEGPHIYKKDGNYYLLIAEGGTSFNHSIMVAVSDTISGPYVSNERNPIFSSRHLSYDNWVHSTGHGDLVELEDGRWYVMMLGVRGDVKRKSNMGRETFIAPVSWEIEPYDWKERKIVWPVIAPQTGKILKNNPMIFSETTPNKETYFVDNFNDTNLGLAWNRRRAPMQKMIDLASNPGSLRLYTNHNKLQERKRANFTGIKQTESDFSFETKMTFSPTSDSDEAGIAIVQKDNNFLSLTLKQSSDDIALELKLMNEIQTSIASKKIDYNSKQPIQLKVESFNNKYHFYYALENQKFQLLAEAAANHLLSHGYSGAHIGLYATSNGQMSTGYVDFDRVEYKSVKK